MSQEFRRRFAVGAEWTGRGGHFRVWAPKRRAVSVVPSPLGPERREEALTAEGDGYFSGLLTDLQPGDTYAFRLDGEIELFPDPASRCQPKGPHGPSRLVDPGRYEWHDAGFQEQRDARVIYELHVGAFTREGTYRAAAERLPDLAELGVTMIELLPINDFPGDFGWGYDGVNQWAPAHMYGSPDDLRYFVDTAHGLGLAVILDVVYNHFGPDGNYLAQFSSSYFTEKYQCEWGEAINFDGEGSGPVREFFCENARYWMEEFHFDGLRIDATQQMFDDSERHIVADVVSAARTGGERLGKRIFIVAENEPQEGKLVRDFGFDALWNDDFHHSATVTLTGQHPAYYSDYRGTPQELISALKWGYLFQGQHYYWQEHRRGTPVLDLNALHFVSYLQNHDQIANSITGARMHELTSPGELRAMTALMLLAPPTPLLFMGQEFDAPSPFLFFADHGPELAAKALQQRVEFLNQFPATRLPAARAAILNPSERATFERCRLDWSARERNAHIVRLYRDLLALRRDDPAIRQRSAQQMHGSVLAERALALRFFCDAGDRLLVVNFGGERELKPVAEPLLACPSGQDWQLLWCSEEPSYGGQGYGPPWADGRFMLPSRAAMLFAPGASQRR